MQTPNEATTSTTQTSAVAEQGAKVAPETKKATKAATSKKTAPKAKKAAKEASPKKAASKPTAKPAAKKEAKSASRKAAKTDGQPREGSKKQIVLLLLARKEGATMAEIADATGWQSHSIRGFISTAAKKLALNIDSFKTDKGERAYRTK